jgi:hypothetical protein
VGGGAATNVTSPCTAPTSDARVDCDGTATYTRPASWLRRVAAHSESSRSRRRSCSGPVGADRARRPPSFPQSAVPRPVPLCAACPAVRSRSTPCGAPLQRAAAPPARRGQGVATGEGCSGGRREKWLYISIHQQQMGYWSRRKKIMYYLISLFVNMARNCSHTVPGG